MKLKRGIVALFLCCFLFITVITIYAAGTAQILVGSYDATPGETVSVPITLNSNSGFVSMTLSVTYDTSALTLISYEDTGVIAGASHSSHFTSPYVLTWENDTLTSNVTSTGTIVYLTFLINEDATEQDYSIIVRIPTDGILDANGDTVSASSAMGTITVSAEHECSFGDWEYYSKTKHVRYCDGDDCDEKEYKNHNWNDGEIILEPTHDTEGEIKYTCEDCRTTKTTKIDPEGHNWNDWMNHSPNQHKRTCSCGGFEYAKHSYINHKCACGAIEYMSVTFMNGAAEWHKSEGRYNSSLDLAEIASPEMSKGYVFVGWYTANGTRIEQGTIITENIIAYAKFIGGDADGNGKIEKNDSNMIIRYILGKTDGVVGDKSSLDINKDGKVTVVDAVTVLLYLAGKVDLIN